MTKQIKLFVRILLSLIFVSGILLTKKAFAEVGTAAWCTVNQNDGTVQCNYQSKEDCETYKQTDEKCVQNPEPNKEY